MVYAPLIKGLLGKQALTNVPQSPIEDDYSHRTILEKYICRSCSFAAQLVGEHPSLFKNFVGNFWVCRSPCVIQLENLRENLCTVPFAWGEQYYAVLCLQYLQQFAGTTITHKMITEPNFIFFRVIFGNSCSAITEPICFWN